MKKIFTLLAIILIAFNFGAVAQTNTTCNAEFSFTISGDTVKFTPVATIDSQLVYHSWSFGDGSAVQNIYAPSHLYSAPGTYTVTDYLVRLNPNKVVVCTDTVKEQVTIPVSCDFTIGYTWKLDSLNHNKVYFTNTSPINTTASVRWYFSDNTAAQDSTWNTTYTFAQAGKYTVCLRIQLTPNCVKYQCDTITIPAPVVCNLQSYFYGAVDTAHFNVVHFTNYTQNRTATDSTFWNFGDGTSSRDSSPTHTFANAGTYNVCLTVTRILTPGAAPCTSQFCRTITITQPCNLTVNFKDSITSAPYTYLFTNLTTGLGTADSSYWVFGDGTTSRDVNPTHIFATAGTYNVCLYVKKVATNSSTVPCTGSICKTFTITQPCDFKISYTWKVDSINHNKVYFTGTSTTTTNASIRWSFGDGSPLDSSGWTTTHVFAQAGKYNVCLRVQLTPNCVQYACDTIVVPPPTTVCNLQAYFNTTVNATDSSTIQFNNYTPGLLSSDSTSWTFGDGSTSTTASPLHTYANAGTYNVCLVVKRFLTPGATPCVNEFCRTITVSKTQPCNFKISYTWKVDSLNHNKIYFAGTTTNTSATASIRWSFGDGTPLDSSGWATTHVFAQPGKYYVCLRVQLTPNCVQYHCDSVTVPVTPPACNIQAYFNSTVDSLHPAIINFHNYTVNLLTTDSTIWTFGDGTTSYDANPTHTFANAGTYNVCLHVKRMNNAGITPCVSEYCRTITVTIPVSCTLVANFYYYKDTLNTTPANVYHFVNTSTPAGDVDSSFWNFGDGTNYSYDKNPTHVFAAPGTYTVCLYIKKANVTGATTTCVARTCETVIVPTVCNVQPAYTWKIDSANNTTVDFTNTTKLSSTAGITVTWSFGDGSTATSWNASHAYAQPGKYYVCLRIQTGSDCVKYQCDSILIPAPAPDCKQISYFIFNHLTTDNQSYSFAPYIPENGIQYTWTFGDGTGSLDEFSKHRYALPGNYTACLTAYRNANCASTTCRAIRVRQQINCDSIHFTYNYYKSGDAPNRVYFYTTQTYPLLQQTWTITNLSNTADSQIVIHNPYMVYTFNDTGYYNICLSAVTSGGCQKEYCNTIHIDAIATPCELYAYPNPVQAVVNVSLQLNSPEVIHAYLYSSQSVLLLQTQQQGNTGTNLVTMKTDNLAAGFYTVKLVYGDRTCFAKFQKL